MTQETELMLQVGDIHQCGCGETYSYADGYYNIRCSCDYWVKHPNMDKAIRLWNKAMQPEDPSKAELIEALDGVTCELAAILSNEMGQNPEDHQDIVKAQEALEKAKGDE